MTEELSHFPGPTPWTSLVTLYTVQKTKVSDLQDFQLVHQEIGHFEMSRTKKIWPSGSVLCILFTSQSMLI